jgi:hypothetical protein
MTVAHQAAMRIFALIVALGGVGCTGRTEIVVGVVTDLKARGQIDLVQFQALRNGAVIVDHEWDLADVPANQYELPGSFGIYSPDGKEVPVELVVSGLRGSAPVVERRALLTLVAGQTLFLRMGLVGDCGTLDGPTCSPGESCIEGVCRAEELNAHRLPPFRPSLVDHVECQSGTRFVISSSGEPMPSEGGDCAADQYCQEGVCLRRLPEDPPAPASQAEWVDTSVPSPLPLRALAGDEAAGDVYAAGEGGVVLHGVGADEPSWTPEDAGAGASLFGVLYVGGEVFAVGSGGLIVHKAGGVWSREMLAVAADRLDAVWGPSPDDIWAVGRAPGNLPLIVHRTGGRWIAARIVGSGGLRAIWGASANDIWAVGADVLHYDGNVWMKVDGGRDFLGVGGMKKAVFAVGRKGLVARLATSGVTVENPPLASDLFAVWAGPGAVYAVGDYGKILVSPGDGTWTEQVSGTEAPLFAVSGLRGHIFAAGRLGKILRKNGITPGPGGCASDADCAAGTFCDAAGACQPQLAQGSACDTDTQCKQAGCRQCANALSCTDHVCCDKSPQECGGCMRCTAPTGTCGPVPAGEDPRGTCAGMTAECTQTTCNGRGSCANSGNSCGMNACSAGMLTTHSCVDGTCAANLAVACANGSPCADGTSCAGKCSDDSGCPAGTYCNQNGDCAVQRDPGNACDTTAHCKTAGCRECSGANQCAFGVCCESACGGQCQMCNSVGKCVTAPAGQPLQGRAACPGGTANCGASCDGVNAACQYAGTGVVCGGPSCSNDHTSSVAYCTGTGKCNNPVATSCGPSGEYACVGAGSCNSSCATSADCASTPFQWTCNTVSGNYCAFPNGHSCGKGTECGSNLCVANSVMALVCCNEPCQAGSSGSYCMGYNPVTGQFTAEGGRAICDTGTCTARAGFTPCDQLRLGVTCDPRIGHCTNLCSCSGPRDANGWCDSDNCDRSRKFRCHGEICEQG